MVIKTKREAVETYALLDNGSTKTIISKRLADRISLNRVSRSTTLHTVEGVTQRQREMADFNVASLEGDLELKVTQALISDFLTAGEDKPPTNAEVAHLDYMKGVSFKELANTEVDLLLSVDHSWTWLGGEMRRSTSDKVMALETRFGWALVGGSGAPEMESCMRTTVEVDNEEVKELVNSIFKGGFPPTESKETQPSLDEEHDIKQMEDLIHSDESIGHHKMVPRWKWSQEVAAKRLNLINSSGPPQDPPKAVELPYLKKQWGAIYENERAVFIEPSDVVKRVPSWVLPFHIVYDQ